MKKQRLLEHSHRLSSLEPVPKSSSLEGHP